MTRTSASILLPLSLLSGLGLPLELLENLLDGRPLRADVVVSRLGEARRVVRMKQEKAEELRSRVPLSAQSAHDPAHTRRQEPALPRGEIGQIARRGRWRRTGGPGLAPRWGNRAGPWERRRRGASSTRWRRSRG